MFNFIDLGYTCAVMAGAPRIAPLTVKQKKFARVVASGATATDAYKSAYNTENMKVTTIHREAHATTRLPQVNAEIQALLSQSGIEVDEILDLHARNMRQKDHLPTSQRAIESFEEMIGLKQDKHTPAINVAFVINGSTEPPNS